MANSKKYIITSLTLGAIAAVSAGLIGLTNLLTNKQIIKNEENKIKAGIAEIFGKNAEVLRQFDINGYKYTNYAYEVTNDEINTCTYALRTTGSNMYGKISLIVGLKDAGEGFYFQGLYLITNEQTYASTLVDNYIDPLNDGDRELDDVSCGATYGAKLVRDMVNEATEVANKDLKIRLLSNG